MHGWLCAARVVSRSVSRQVRTGVWSYNHGRYVLAGHSVTENAIRALKKRLPVHDAQGVRGSSPLRPTTSPYSNFGEEKSRSNGSL